MGKPLTFKLARVAHGERNRIDGVEESLMQAEAQQKREVLLPGVDLATAFAMQLRCGPRPIRAKPLRHVSDAEEDYENPEQYQIVFDTARAERGFAMFIPESWDGLHHLVRYFDLIEKNEAPDTPLLEWLVTAGAVHYTAALQAVERFERKVTLGRHDFVLDAEDAARLKMAAEVRQILETEERNRRS